VPDGGGFVGLSIFEHVQGRIPPCYGKAGGESAKPSDVKQWMQ
jgi:hypothetical protein